jgi:hypothetical protein
VDREAVFARRLGEPMAVERIVVVAEEDALPVVAALDDVQRLIGEEQAANARNGCELCRHTRNNSTLTPITQLPFL